MKDRWTREVTDAKVFLRKMTMVSTKSQDDDEKSKVNISFYHYLGI